MAHKKPDEYKVVFLLPNASTHKRKAKAKFVKSTKKFVDFERVVRAHNPYASVRDVVEVKSKTYAIARRKGKSFNTVYVVVNGRVEGTLPYAEAREFEKAHC